MSDKRLQDLVTCGSSKLNAAESLMQEAPPWKAALCMAWSSTAMRVVIRQN
jgi:hypothetical protein